MKNNISIFYITAFLLVINNVSIAKIKALNNSESLKLKSYSYLETATNNRKQEIAMNLLYAKAWLLKSKSEQNWTQAAKAYKSLMHFDDKTKMLKYSDSLIAAAIKSKDAELIGMAYLTKGIIYYDKKDINKALDNYLLADKYISKTKNEYTINKLKYSIAHTKYYLGFYDEAIKLFKGCLYYFEEENDRAYLNTIHSLGLCYNKIGNYNLCTYYNELGLQESKTLENSEMKIYFKHSEGINQYFKKKYTTAINELKEVIPYIHEKEDTANESVAYFYIGKSYWGLKQQNKALPYLLKVDKAFVEHNYIRPDLRENYELLINWYNQQNNLELQLMYINRLIEVDKILNKNYKYLSKKIFKEYDTKKLVEEKQEVEQSMKSKSRILYLLLATLSATIAFLAFRHYKNKKHYKRKFEELMNSNINSDKKIEINNTTVTLDINPEVIEVVLKNLEKFEKNKKYLEKEMSLIRIASLLNTNTKYASKIIYNYRGKKTIDYISDLKIEYIIMLLKNENKYRLYTNKALAEEIGFGSTQNFTRAFKNRTGISPTYFIQKLKE